MGKFAEEQIGIFIQAFSNFDEQADGSVDVRNIGELLKLVNLSPSEEEIQYFVTKIEESNKDLIQKTRIDQTMEEIEELEQETEKVIRMGFVDFMKILEEFRDKHPEQFEH